jgi:hypothetical protein
MNYPPKKNIDVLASYLGDYSETTSLHQQWDYSVQCLCSHYAEPLCSISKAPNHETIGPYVRQCIKWTVESYYGVEKKTYEGLSQEAWIHQFF